MISKLGARIEYGGSYGTVKYIGPVEGYKGVWLGIDWDDPERGKHNGTVNKVPYFETRYPTSGSFVHREKVNFGQTLIESVKIRYGCVEDEHSAKLHQQQLLKFKQDINAPFLEMVGFNKVADKQRNFHTLKVIGVREQNVSSVGDPLELQSLCPNIRELDISKNLLLSWQDIFSICTQLKTLFWLNVSENQFSQLPEDCTEYNFSNISVLICGYMNLTWEDVKKLSRVFPSISELRVPFNSITDLTTPPDHYFSELRYVDLEGNAIRSWSEVLKLSVIGCIEHLVLENTKLQSIYFNENESNKFPNLGSVNITDNLISEWSSIGELNKVRNLEHLRLSKNPVLETEDLATTEQIIIAKIKSLKTLNGTVIRDDRRGAEYDYLKKYTLEWLNVRDTPERDNFLICHNRYLELIEKYGLPEESEVTVKPNVIKTTLVEVYLDFDGKLLKKQVPMTIIVQKLIMLIQKLFKLQERPQLKLISGQVSDITVELDDDMKELGFFSVQDGDTIQVKV